MDTLIALLQMLNSLSPLAVIALLGLVIFLLVRGNSQTIEIKEKTTEIKENDLHILPEMADTLRRIEVQQAAAFSTIIAKLNGR